MAYPIERKLVIAVSSSAVFDMTEANSVFIEQGEEAYRKYQRQHINRPFAQGVAFQFIKRLLNLNKIWSQEQPIEVVVLSRNDPDSGRRFFRSCRKHKLDITRGVFLSGKSPHPYVPAFNAALFLSATQADILNAIEDGLPAGLVLPTSAKDNTQDQELRIAFDFDGVLADDEPETVFRNKNLKKFQQFEVSKSRKPHNPGPLKDLITRIAIFQRLEATRAKKSQDYKPLLRIAIVTARNAPAHERLITTLNHWKITAAETFFLGGIEKKRVLDVLKPHIFFDDQLRHLIPTAASVPSVHIPFGIANRPTETEPVKGATSLQSKRPKVGI